MEKAEAAGSTIHFKSKSKSNQSYDGWMKKAMAIPRNSNKMLPI